MDTQMDLRCAERARRLEAVFKGLGCEKMQNYLLGQAELMLEMQNGLITDMARGWRLPQYAAREAAPVMESPRD